MKFQKIRIQDYKAYMHDVAMKNMADILIDRNVQYFMNELPIPQRATSGSAGYDFVLPYDVVIEPHERVLVATGIRVQLDPDKVLLMFIRSSLSKQGIELGNQVSVIDSDYYDNPTNGGHIFEYLINHTDKRVILPKGTRAFQGVIVQYFVTEDDAVGSGRLRVGGFGSTDMMETTEKEEPTNIVSFPSIEPEPESESNEESEPEVDIKSEPEVDMESITEEVVEDKPKEKPTFTGKMKKKHR